MVHCYMVIQRYNATWLNLERYKSVPSCRTDFLGYVHTKPDKFKNVTFFYRDRPSVHTKTAFPVTENATF